MDIHSLLAFSQKQEPFSTRAQELHLWSFLSQTTFINCKEYNHTLFFGSSYSLPPCGYPYFELFFGI